jgi:hypothetical protein
MAAKKSKRREKKAASSKKAPARKAAVGRKRVTGFEKRIAKELLGPIERAGESVVVAARRLWLSAESLLATRGGSRRKPKRKTRI